MSFSPQQLSSKPGFYRQNSERRSFRVPELRKTNRDTGISSPSRISPPSTPSSPDDTPCLHGDPYNRRRRKIPKVKKSDRPLAEIMANNLWPSTLHRRVWSQSTQASVKRWVTQNMPESFFFFFGMFAPQNTTIMHYYHDFVVETELPFTKLKVNLFFPDRWCWKSMPSLRHGEARNTQRRYLSPQSPAQEEVSLWMLSDWRPYAPL